MRVLDNNDIVRMLSAEVRKAGSQEVWAKRAGIDRAFVSNVLHSRRQPTEKLIRALGLRRVLRQKLRLNKELNVEDVIRLLRAEVQRAGSITAFAKIAGVDRTTVHRILRGQMPPSPKIVHTLGLRMVIFLPK
jgi:DNA-binding phage protein